MRLKIYKTKFIAIRFIVVVVVGLFFLNLLTVIASIFALMPNVLSSNKRSAIKTLPQSNDVAAVAGYLLL